jgi:hypothetical protein
MTAAGFPRSLALLLLAGIEFGNSQSGTIGSIIQTYDVRTRFFDQANVAFYPTDNLEIYAGHRYLGGLNAAAFGGEWGIPLGGGMMAGLFAEGYVGELPTTACGAACGSTSAGKTRR